jgi:amino acid transporter
VFGLKLYARVQRYIFWPALLCLLLVFAMLLTSDTHTFRDNFDSFMASKFHVRNAYATIISRSSVSSAFSLKATVLALPIAAYGLIFPAWSAFQAGEVRQANSTRKNIFALVGAEVVAAGLAACAAFLLIHLVGSHFFAASADLNFNNPTKYPLPVPPYFSLFATFAAGPAFMTFLLFATGILWFWMIAPNVPLGVSRAMMAMSLDRVLPEAFGRVSSRSHTPVFSLLFSGVIALAACGLYLASPSVLAFTASFIMLSLITFVVTMVAGILLPIRRKDLYNAAPAAVRTRFLSVPVIVSAAVVFIAFSCFVFFESLTRGAYGVNTTKGLVAIAVYYAVSLVVYVSAKVYRKRVDHFDLTLVYKQLPVE